MSTLATLIAEDFRVFDHGSIIALRPVSEAGRAWIAENVDPGAQWHGSSLCIEPRYFEAIYHGIVEDGLTIA
jgi:hypothetical protein